MLLSGCFSSVSCSFRAPTIKEFDSYVYQSLSPCFFFMDSWAPRAVVGICSVGIILGYSYTYMLLVHVVLLSLYVCGYGAEVLDLIGFGIV